MRRFFQRIQPSPFTRMLYPISFSIPESKIVHAIPEKTKLLATTIPYNNSTYIFNDEETYRKDYQSSIFAITHKKGGWDCMRHYEILANGCIPYFTDLSNCPADQLQLFPKALVKAAMEASTKPNFSPEFHIQALLDYTRTHLTTVAMAKYILEKSNNQDAKSVLFLTGDKHPDYLRCLTLHGFKSLFKKDCHDIICVFHLYDRFPEEKVPELYGKGFSYARTLKYEEMRDDERDKTLMQDLLNKRYDIIVYGSVHRGAPMFDQITGLYPPEKIIYLCGEDNHKGGDLCFAKTLNPFSPCFLREY